MYPAAPAASDHISVADGRKGLSFERSDHDALHEVFLQEGIDAQHGHGGEDDGGILDPCKMP